LVVANPTWSGEVHPLFEADCRLCHSGRTGPVGLESVQAWRDNFGEILDRIENDDMPAGRPPLTPLEKGIIRAWGAKGFQE
jgi:hypothetical protein